jgi:hypothetical protein
MRMGARSAVNAIAPHELQSRYGHAVAGGMSTLQA